MSDTVDLNQVKIVLFQARKAAQEAASTAYAQVGERDACGFAWVTVYKVRSNSRLGKVLAEAGFSKSYTGGLQLWNPSGHNTQSISVKEAGAYAYAEQLKTLGIEAHAGSRMD